VRNKCWLTKGSSQDPNVALVVWLFVGEPRFLAGLGAWCVVVLLPTTIYKSTIFRVQGRINNPRFFLAFIQVGRYVMVLACA